MGTHVQTGLQGLEVMPNTLFLRIQPVQVLEKIEGVARAVSCSSHEGSADARAVLLCECSCRNVVWMRKTTAFLGRAGQQFGVRMSKPTSLE